MQVKSRENIPEGSLARVAYKTGVSVEWLETGEGEIFTDGHGRGLDRELLLEIIKFIEETQAELKLKIKPQKKPSSF